LTFSNFGCLLFLERWLYIYIYIFVKKMAKFFIKF
jgi:hypothetical protein